MGEEEYIETIQINDYFELQDIIQGRNDYADFRDDFIYRGINKKSYKLIPSSLRDNNILDYIGSDYNHPVSLRKDDALRCGLNIEDKVPDEQGFYKFKLNKYDEFENGVKVDNQSNLNQFKLGKEMYVLFNFIFYLINMV